MRVRSLASLHSDFRGSTAGFSRMPAHGFTLIETMIVVSIIAIIIAIAYPSYVNQVRKARRADASSSLLSNAQLLERCFTRFNSYIAAGCPDPAGPSGDSYYAISVVRTASTYTLTATPAGDQSNDPCGTFILEHLGNRTPEPDNNRCWGS